MLGPGDFKSAESHTKAPRHAKLLSRNPTLRSVESVILAKTTNAQESIARDYADRLVLQKLTELYEVVKPSEIADELSGQGIGIAAIRALLASNPGRFAYAERRWIPASRIESEGRPVAEKIVEMATRFGAPMPVSLIGIELSRTIGIEDEDRAEEVVRRHAGSDPRLVLTMDDHVVAASLVFAAKDESIERAFAINGVTAEEVEDVQKALGKFDWRDEDAIVKAVEKASPVSVKALGAAAWLQLNPQDSFKHLLYDWKAFNSELLSIPGFIFSVDGYLYPESEAKGWLATAGKIAGKLDAVIEIEDAAPLELKKDDIEGVIKDIVKADGSLTATSLLAEKFEVTQNIKTFPDDLENMMNALKADSRVSWVGGDRFQKPGLAPDFINEVPEPFQFLQTAHKQEDGDPVDIELTDEGLSSSLRKLMVHPLATDVLDEEILPSPKTMPESLRLVLKPIHRELGTFPLSQFPTGWFGIEPKIQEVIFRDSQDRELQVWLNHEARLMFNLFEWWLDQPVESGAVFQLTKTDEPNVLEFNWLEQTDPVVYISNQRIEELREIASGSADKSTFELLTEVMAHWPKGADFLTVLWELNVVRRTSRRMLASLLSSYVCFYQRSGSPVWHYDHKKVEQGFDKSKKKFIKP